MAAGGHWLSFPHRVTVASHHYAIALGDHQFLDQPFIVGRCNCDTTMLTRVPGQSLTAAIWDRADGESQVAYIESHPPVA